MPRSSKAEWQHQKYTERCHWSFSRARRHIMMELVGCAKCFGDMEHTSGTSPRVIELCTAGSCRAEVMYDRYRIAFAM
jgi:hypothetical protein